MAPGGHQEFVAHGAAPVSVALANDFGHVVADLEARLRRHPDAVRVVDAEAGAADLGTAEVLLFDTFGTRRSAIRRLRALTATGRHQAVVVSVLQAPDLFLDALDRLGVDAVVPSGLDAATLVSVLRSAAAGRRSGPMVDPGDTGPSSLPTSEAPVGADAEVVALLLGGMSESDVADELMRTEQSVREAVLRSLRILSVGDVSALRADGRIRHLFAAERGERWRDLHREPGQVALARRFVEERLRRGEADADTLALFRLAVSELGANAVEHGGGTTWTVGAYGSRDWWSLEVSCTDSERAELLRRPWEWVIATAHQPSGRGLGIVRAVMDEVTTTRLDDQLRVICRRRRQRGESPSYADEAPTDEPT